MTAPSMLQSSTPRLARRAALAASAAVTTLAWCAAAYALPQVGTAGGVVGGSATIGTIGTTETINQTSARALIQWQSFNVGNGETVNFVQPSSSSITFNVIPYTYNNPANILGAINANGGVWLYSPRGVIIGGGAQISVGSLVVTTGTTDYTLAGGNFPAIPPELNGNTIQIFGATASIDVKSGATINAGSGFVVLHSEALTQNGSVTASDGVAYAVGDSANITFEPGEESGLILDGVDVSGSNPGEPALNHGGSTTGAWVGVYAPNTEEEGFTSVINMGGSTEATSIAPSSALKTAVLLVGGPTEAGPQGFNNTVTDVNTTGAQKLQADNGGIYVNSGQAELGSMTASGFFSNGDIIVEVGGDPNNNPGTPNYQNVGGINVNYFATLQAVGGIYLASNKGPVNLSYFSTLHSDTTGEGEGDVYIEGQTVYSDPTSTIYGGTATTSLSDTVTIRADGGSLQSGQIDAFDVNLEARGSGFEGLDGGSPGEGPGGDLTIAGNINADNSINGVSDFGNVIVNPGVTLTSYGTGSASISLSANNSLDVEGNLIGSGSVSLTTTNGDITIGTNPNNIFGEGQQAVLIQSDAGGYDAPEEGGGAGSGTLTVTAGGAVSAYSGSELRGGQSATMPTDPVTVTSQDGDLTIGQVNGYDVTLSTAEGDDLTVNGAVYGANSVTIDPYDATLNANVTSGKSLDISASNSITISAGVTVRSDSLGNGTGTLTLEAPTITADATSLLVAGPVGGSPTSSVSATTTTGDLTVGQVQGDAVTLTAGSEKSDEGGNVIINGAVLATNDDEGTSSVTVNAYQGKVDVEANITSSGTVSISAGKDIDIGQTKGAGPVLINSDSNDNADTGSGTITLTAGGNVVAATSSELRSGSDPTNPDDAVSVTANGGDLTIGKVEGTAVTLTGTDTITVNGAIYGSQSVNFDPYDIIINANVTSGGKLDINATNSVTISAGVIIQSAGDLSIEANTIDGDATSELLAGSDPTAPTGKVSITAGTGTLTLGKISGTVVTIVDGVPQGDCGSDCPPTGGDVNLDGAILGTTSVSATAYNGGIDVEANVISGGAVTLDAANDVDIGTDKDAPAMLLIQSDSGGTGAGAVSIDAGGAVEAEATSEVRGGKSATAPNDDVIITAEGGDLTSGQVEGANVTLSTADDLTINGAVLGTASVTFDPANVYINADVTSGGTLDVTATNSITVNAGVTVMSAGDLTFTAGSFIDADATSLIVAGSDANTPTGDVTITAEGGDLTLGQVTGETVLLNSGIDADSDSGGNVNLLGAVFGSKSVTVNAFIGTIDVEANVTSAGAVAMTSGEDIDVGTDKGAPANLLIQSDTGGAGSGAIVLTAGRIYDAEAGSELRGGKTAASPDDAVTVITQGGDLTTGQVEGTNVTLTTASGSDLTVNGAVYGSKSVTFDPANVFINADVTSGGVLNITATETVTVSAGVTVQSAGAMTINALSVDADASSLLVAGSSATAPTAGVSVTATGGDLSVGAVTGTVVSLTSGSSNSKTAGDVDINGNVLGSTSIAATAFNGAVDVEANLVSAGGVTLIAGTDIDIGTDEGAPAAVLIQSDSGGTGAGAISLTAGGAVDAAATSELRGGATAAGPDDNVTVIANGGDLTSGLVEGTNVTLTTAKGDDLTINGAVYGSKSVTFDPANVFIHANVTSGGGLAITATNTITVDAGVTVRSDSAGAGTGNLSMTAGAITANTTSNIIAGPNSASPPTANVTLKTTSGDMSLGAVNGKVVGLTSAGKLNLNGAVLGTTSVTGSSTGDTNVNSTVAGQGFDDFTAGGNLTLAGGASFTAGEYVDLTAGNITLDANSVVRSDAKGTGAAGTAIVSIDAHNSYLADPTSLVVAGASQSAPTSSVTIVAGDNKAGTGGNLTAGPTSGVNVHLTADGSTQEEGGNGNLTIAGAVLGTQGVFAYSNPTDDGSLPGAVTISANVTSGGIIDVRSMGTGAITLNTGTGSGPTVVSSSGGAVYMLANDNNLSIGSNVQVTGVTMDLVSFGTLSVASGATVNTTGSSTGPTWPEVPQTVVAGSGGAAPTITSLNLAAENINLAGSVTSGKSGARDDIYIQALGAPSLVTVGGTSGPAGFDLTSSSFGELTGRTIVVEAGYGEGGAHNANLQLASLAIDPSAVQSLWLGTSSGQTISVTGAVTGPGVNLELGFAVDPVAVLGGYIPGEIDITGSLGTTLNPMGSVGLLARNNIFMGTSGFITAAEGDSTFDAVTQSKDYTGLAQGYVFVAANTLELAAQGRIIQQNTSTLTGVGQQQFAGLAINAPTAQTPLISAVAALQGQTIGTEGWTANYAAGPTKIDVFGVLRQSNATLVSGVDAALLPNLLDTGIATSNAYRINSCIFGTDCGVTTPTNPLAPYQGTKDQLSFQPPLDPSNDYTPPPTVTTFVSNIVISDTTFVDTLKNGAPVTESGNGDLWNGPSGQGSCPPGADPTKCPPSN